MLPIIERKWLSAKLFTGKDIRFRPFTIGQQKILLIVKETDENEKSLETYKAVIKMVSECVEGVNVEDLHPSEFEQLFYIIRSTSDSKLLKLTSVCKNPTGVKVKNDKNEDVDQTCDTENELAVNLVDDFTVLNATNFKTKIIIKEENMAVDFRQPKLKDLMKIETKQYPTEETRALDILSYCIDNVMHKDQNYSEFTYDDANKFLNSLPDTYLKNMMEFFKDQPSYALKEDKIVKCIKCQHETKFGNGDLKGFL